MSHPGPALPPENMVAQTQHSWVMTEPKSMKETNLAKLLWCRDRLVPLPISHFSNSKSAGDSKHLLKPYRTGRAKEGRTVLGTLVCPGPLDTPQVFWWPPLSQNSHSVFLGPGCDFYLLSLNLQILIPMSTSGLGSPVHISGV